MTPPEGDKTLPALEKTQLTPAPEPIAQPPQPQPQKLQPQAQKPSGTGSYMSTRATQTGTGSGQTRFTAKTKTITNPHGLHGQTDSFKVQHQHTSPAEAGGDNVYRRFPRVPFVTEVIMRDDREYYRFRSMDISEKGVQINVEDTSLFEKGEEVTITVRNAPGIGTFSCKGVVMRILRSDEGPGYGIFFMHLNPIIRRRIIQYVLDQMSGQISGRTSRSVTRGGPEAA
jgi:hypothetical protein